MAPKSLFLTHDCDGPVKKAIVNNFANQVGRKFKTHFSVNYQVCLGIQNKDLGDASQK